MLNTVQAIFFNIVGGVLTIVVVGLVRGALKRYSRLRFKNIFGGSTEKYHLVYTGFVLRPEFRRHVPQIAPDLLKFPLAKPYDSEFRISAEGCASACEIRAASYVGPTLARNLGVEVSFVDDSAVRETLDVDFVSFGGWRIRS
jgi:hypothetical protein